MYRLARRPTAQPPTDRTAPRPTSGPDAAAKQTGAERAASIDDGRPVADLQLAEQIVLWSVRRHKVRPDGLTSEYRRIFRDEAEAALTAFHCMIGLMSDDARRGIGALDTEWVTDIEAAVLAALHVAQSGHPMATDRWIDLAPKGGIHALMDAATDFAIMLLNHSFRLPHGTDRRGYHGPARPEDRGAASEPGDGVLGLAPAERWLVGAIRYWVRQLQQNESTVPALERQFERIGQPDAAQALHAFMVVVATSASRTIDVRCPNCRSVSSDEAGMLAAVASLQRDGGDAAEGILGVWLPNAAARIGRTHLAVLASGLTAAGFVLPERPWTDRAGLDDEPRPTPGAHGRLDLAAWPADPDGVTVH